METPEIIRLSLQQGPDPVFLSGNGSVCLADRRIESPLAGARCLCLSTSGDSGPSGHQGVGLGLPQNDSNCTGVAQHALVLGSGQLISSNSPMFTKGGEPSDSSSKSVHTGIS